MHKRGSSVRNGWISRPENLLPQRQKSLSMRLKSGRSRLKRPRKKLISLHMWWPHFLNTQNSKAKTFVQFPSSEKFVQSPVVPDASFLVSLEILLSPYSSLPPPPRCSPRAWLARPGQRLVKETAEPLAREAEHGPNPSC